MAERRGTPVALPPPPQTCAECRALVTTLGQTHGVLCSHPACPHDRLGPEPRAAVGKTGWKYQPREGPE